ncbi:ABC transporter substrate-binding protein [Paenibacillus sp. GCM10027629]|uniref:ABC transporter substrate-binding protein n=1 Tax=Paenibacillus sp. GCM10027629 TaxID=3273414 RepID=UPI00363E8F4C
MFKKAKRFSVLSIVLVMVLVTACSGGGGAKPADQAKGNDNKPAVENKQPDPQPEPPKEEVIDMKNKPIRVMSWGVPFGEAGSELGEKKIALEKEMSAKYNTKFEHVQATWNDIGDKVVTSVMAGEPIADIFLIETNRAIPAMVKNDMLTPISDFLDVNDPKWPAKMKEIGGYNGKAYGFTTSLGGGSGIYYNRGLIKKEGLEDPQELMEKGQWNWESFLNIAKTVTKDTNGDGQLDQYGVALDANSFVRALIASNGSDITKVVDGKVVYDGENPGAMEALHFFNDLYQVHKVVKPNKDGNWDDYINSFNKGNIAMRYGEFWEGEGIKNSIGDDYGFIFYPKGPKAQDYVYSTDAVGMWWVPKGANQDAVKLFIDYLFETAPPAGEVDAWVEAQFADEKSLQNSQKMADYINLVTWAGVPEFGATIRQTWNDIGAGKETPETGMAKVKPVLEGLIKAAEK